MKLQENIIKIVSVISDENQELIAQELIASKFHIELLKKKECWNVQMIKCAIRILGNIAYYDADIMVLIN